MSYDEQSYLSNIHNRERDQVGRASASPVEDYRRIKQEEAAARAMLMAKPVQARPALNAKYKPSANALAAYSPLRNEA